MSQQHIALVYSQPRVSLASLFSHVFFPAVTRPWVGLLSMFLFRQTNLMLFGEKKKKKRKRQIKLMIHPPTTLNGTVSTLEEYIHFYKIRLPPKCLHVACRRCSNSNLKCDNSNNEDILKPQWLLRKVLSTFKPQCMRDERDLNTPAEWRAATCPTNKPFYSRTVAWAMEYEQSLSHIYWGSVLHCCWGARVHWQVQMKAKWHPDRG